MEYDRLLERADITEEHRATISFLRYAAVLMNAIDQAEVQLYDTPDDFVSHYAQRDYLIDTSYRKAHVSYTHIGLMHQHKVIALHDKMHSAYDSHLIKQNTAWQDSMAAIKFDYTQLATQKQYHFYRDHIENFDYKGAVIISDAFRYCLLYTSPSPRDQRGSRMPSSA